MGGRLVSGCCPSPSFSKELSRICSITAQRHIGASRPSCQVLTAGELRHWGRLASSGARGLTSLSPCSQSPRLALRVVSLSLIQHATRHLRSISCLSDAQVMANEASDPFQQRTASGNTEILGNLA